MSFVSCGIDKIFTICTAVKISNSLQVRAEISVFKLCRAQGEYL